MRSEEQSGRLEECKEIQELRKTEREKKWEGSTRCWSSRGAGARIQKEMKSS